MTIYIESFLIQNTLINLCLLRLITISIRPRTNIIRCAIAAVFGAVISAVASNVINQHLCINIIKLLCGIAMIIIAFNASVKQTTLCLILLFVFTYTFGGLIMNFASIYYTTEYGIIYSSSISIELIAGIIIAGTYIYEKIVKMLKLKFKINDLIYRITLISNTKKLHLNAYLDTGNFLNINGEPILIIDVNTYLKLSGKTLIDFYLEGGETISAGTVSGQSDLKLIKIDKLLLRTGQNIKTFTNPYIAINACQIFKGTNYQALLTPLFL